MDIGHLSDRETTTIRRRRSKADIPEVDVLIVQSEHPVRLRNRYSRPAPTTQPNFRLGYIQSRCHSQCAERAAQIDVAVSSTPGTVKQPLAGGVSEAAAEGPIGSSDQSDGVGIIAGGIRAGHQSAVHRTAEMRALKIGFKAEDRRPLLPVVTGMSAGHPARWRSRCSSPKAGKNAPTPAAAGPRMTTSVSPAIRQADATAEMIKLRVRMAASNTDRPETGIPAFGINLKAVVRPSYRTFEE